MQASNAFISAGAAAPDEFYDAYSLDVEAQSQWARARRRFFRHRLAVISLVVLTLVFAAGFLSSRLAPFGYEAVNIKALSSSPTWAHPFGTDQVGRDYFSRTLFGIRTEAEIALLVGFFGTLIGVIVGSVSGYFGGLVDNVVMRFVDLLLTLPPLITLLVAATFFQADTLWKVCLLLSALLWMPLARIARGTTLSIRDREYVEAARAMGAGDLRIIFRHVVPNTLSSVTVAATVMTAGAVILETTLSYLGVGVSGRFYTGRTDTKLPSLGDVMAAASSEGLFHWWGIVFPGLVVILIVAPIYFVGDGLRDAFDPSGRGYVSERPLRRTTRLRKVMRALPRPALLAWQGPPISVRIRMPRPIRRAVDAVSARHEARRRQGRLRLLLETFGVLAVTLAGAAGIYAWQHHPVKSAWRLAGADLVDVSRAPGAQTQVAVAADPTRSGVLFAASNDTLLRTVRVYGSANAGRTWTSTPGAQLQNACARGDPSVAVDGQRREFVAFTVSGDCTPDDETPYVAVAVRSGPAGLWTVHRLGPRRQRDFWDDYPSVAAGPDGRIYVAWSRLLSWNDEGIVVSSSADHGRTWSAPRVVDRRLSFPRLATTTVGPDGSLFVAGADAHFGIWVARSRNGGRTFRLAQVAQLPGNRTATCATASAHPTPYQGNRCVGPNPTVAVGGERVFVTYGVGWPGERESVHIGVLDAALRPIWRGPVGPDAASADRFWPASAFDASTGRLWVCFYDTSGDSSKKQAWFSCTHSADGRRWAKPLRAARSSASTDVLWEDARVYAFGDTIGYGGYADLTVSGGVLHPLWVDTRDPGGAKQEIYSARLAVR